MAGPLEGFRVLELGNLIAAPYAGYLFGAFGAEVIKVERPGVGDELRRWRLIDGDTSAFWYTFGRNKKSVTLDLRHPEGQAVALDLVERSDVVLENFRPGTLERWNLSPERLREINPGIIVVRISGYGQTGPYRDRPGFGGIAESIGGIRHMTGWPDRPPTRVGVSIGDTLAGMYGTIGALMSLLHRERGGSGQVVDVALYESVFAVLESTVPEFDGYGVVRGRTGNTLPGIAPSNIYPCRDDKWVMIGGNTDRVFPRLMEAIGRPDVAHDERFSRSKGRADYSDYLDEAIEAWTLTKSVDEVMEVMVDAGVPAGPINDAPAMVEDEHFKDRGMLEEHEVELHEGRPERIRFPGIVPKLSETPGGTEWPGPRLGEHNDEVFGSLLGLDASRLRSLRSAKVI